MEMTNVFWKLEERHGFCEVGMKMAGLCLWSHVLWKAGSVKDELVNEEISTQC